MIVLPFLIGRGQVLRSRLLGMRLFAQFPVNGMVRRITLEDVECGARRHLMKIHALGIDLGKTVFHLVGLDTSGQVVVRKRCSRTQLLAFTRICKWG